MDCDYNKLTLEEVLSHTKATQDLIDARLRLMAEIGQQLRRTELDGAVQQGCCRQRSLQEANVRLMHAMHTAEAAINGLFATMRKLNVRRSQLL